MTTENPPHVRAIWAETVTTSGNIIMGSDGRLPWPTESADLKHFREATRDRVLIMGRRTFDSLPPALKTVRATQERPLIVLTSKPETLSPIIARNEKVLPIHWVSDQDDVETLIRLAGSFFGKDLAVIGGPTVIELFWPQTHEAFITTIDGNYTGDTRAPFAPVVGGGHSLSRLGNIRDRKPLSDTARLIHLSPTFDFQELTTP